MRHSGERDWHYKEEPSRRRPLDFVLKGTIKDNGCTNAYGLQFMSDKYVVLDPITEMCSWTFGLPMRRGRVFLVMIRRDVFTSYQAECILRNVAEVATHPIPQGNVLRCMSIIDAEPMENKTPKKDQMSSEGVRQSIEFRRMHGLLPYNSKGGRPVHEEPGRYGAQDMSDREKEVLNCAGPSVCLQGRS